MELHSSRDGELIIRGNIKTITDYEDIKRAIKEQMNRDVKDIDVKIENSSSITSSVVGFFLKVINKDKINLKVMVKDDRLYKILKDLNLLELFKVSKL